MAAVAVGVVVVRAQAAPKVGVAVELVVQVQLAAVTQPLVLMVVSLIPEHFQLGQEAAMAAWAAVFRTVALALLSTPNMVVVEVGQTLKMEVGVLLAVDHFTAALAAVAAVAFQEQMLQPEQRMVAQRKTGTHPVVPPVPEQGLVMQELLVHKH